VKTLEESVREIRTELLQTHLDGKLNGPEAVMEIVQRNQPPSGLDNASWNNLCNFILEIEYANVIPRAKEIAKKYGLELTL
jgi:hypothetical protein